MSMRSILTLNAGSSSLKFALFGLIDVHQGQLLGGQIATDGGGGARFLVRECTGNVLVDRRYAMPSGVIDADRAIEILLHWLSAAVPKLQLSAVGHRVVHGGPDFSRPTALDDAVIAELTRLAPLAPLHQPFNLKAIAAARAAFPNVPQVACFDTAFHNGHAFEEAAFGLPRSYYDEGIRRYGFHGLSYDYVARQLARIAPGVADERVVIAHLGNGASLCAMRNGRSVASTMGFSALDGLLMGTRCGGLDPGVLLYLMAEKQMDAAALTTLLYRESGLKGLSGVSHDMRALEASAEPHAEQAIACFVARIRREIGAMAAAMGGIDALVFTGGIGENSARIRAAVTDGFDWLGIGIDPARNTDDPVELTSPSARVRVFRIPTDEDAMIARHVAGLMAAAAADLVPLDQVKWAA
jgi:acetate kinase